MLIKLADESLVTLVVERDTQLYWEGGQIWTHDQIVYLTNVEPDYTAGKLELRHTADSWMHEFRAGKTPSWGSIKKMDDFCSRRIKDAW